VKNEVVTRGDCDIRQNIVVFSGLKKIWNDGGRCFRRLPKWKVLKILWRQYSPYVRIISGMKTWN